MHMMFDLDSYSHSRSPAWRETRCSRNATGSPSAGMVGVSDSAGFPETCRRTAALAREAGDLLGETWAANGEGMAHGYLGQFPAALDALARADRLVERLGNYSQRAMNDFARSIHCSTTILQRHSPPRSAPCEALPLSVPPG